MGIERKTKKKSKLAKKGLGDKIIIGNESRNMRSSITTFICQRVMVRLDTIQTKVVDVEDLWLEMDEQLVVSIEEAYSDVMKILTMALMKAPSQSLVSTPSQPPQETHVKSKGREGNSWFVDDKEVKYGTN